MSLGINGWHASKDNSGPIEVEIVGSMEKRSFRVVKLSDSHNNVVKRGTHCSRDVVKVFDLPTVDLPFSKGFIIEGGLVSNKPINITADLILHHVLEKRHHLHALM